MVTETQSDNELIELVAKIMSAAQTTGDDRIINIARHALEQLHASENAIPTLLIRYNHLLSCEDEFNRGRLELELPDITRG